MGDPETAGKLGEAQRRARERFGLDTEPQGKEAPSDEARQRARQRFGLEEGSLRNDAGDEPIRKARRRFGLEQRGSGSGGAAEVRNGMEAAVELPAEPPALGGKEGERPDRTADQQSPDPPTARRERLEEAAGGEKELRDALTGPPPAQQSQQSADKEPPRPDPAAAVSTSTRGAAQDRRQAIRYGRAVEQIEKEREAGVQQMEEVAARRKELEAEAAALKAAGDSLDESNAEAVKAYNRRVKDLRAKMERFNEEAPARLEEGRTKAAGAVEKLADPRFFPGEQEDKTTWTTGLKRSYWQMQQGRALDKLLRGRPKATSPAAKNNPLFAPEPYTDEERAKLAKEAARYTRQMGELPRDPRVAAAQAEATSEGSTQGEAVAGALSQLEQGGAGSAYNLVTSSSLQSLPSILTTSLGALAGSVFGPAGAKAGSSAGAFVGSASVEEKAALAQYLMEEGVDITDPKALGQALKGEQGQQLAERVRRRAKQRGGAVGTVEAFFASALPALEGTNLSQVSRSGAGFASETLGEAGGEVAGQALAGEDIRFGEGAIEAVAGAGQSAATSTATQAASAGQKSEGRRTAEMRDLSEEELAERLPAAASEAEADALLDEMARREQEKRAVRPPLTGSSAQNTRAAADEVPAARARVQKRRERLRRAEQNPAEAQEQAPPPSREEAAEGEAAVEGGTVPASEEEQVEPNVSIDEGQSSSRQDGDTGAPEADATEEAQGDLGVGSGRRRTYPSAEAARQAVEQAEAEVEAARQELNAKRDELGDRGPDEPQSEDLFGEATEEQGREANTSGANAGGQSAQQSLEGMGERAATQEDFDQILQPYRERLRQAEQNLVETREQARQSERQRRESEQDLFPEEQALDEGPPNERTPNERPPDGPATPDVSPAPAGAPADVTPNAPGQQGGTVEGVGAEEAAGASGAPGQSGDGAAVGGRPGEAPPRAGTEPELKKRALTPYPFESGRYEVRPQPDGRLEVVNTETEADGTDRSGVVDRRSSEHDRVLAEYFAENSAAIDERRARLPEEEVRAVGVSGYPQAVAQSSENPIELAEAHTIAQQQARHGQRAENDPLLRALRENAPYNSQGDAVRGRASGDEIVERGLGNWVTRGRTDTMSLGQVADETGTDVGDLLDVMENNPGGPTSLQSAPERAMSALEDQFQNVTGKTLTPELANEIADAQRPAPQKASSQEASSQEAPDGQTNAQRPEGEATEAPFQRRGGRESAKGDVQPRQPAGKEGTQEQTRERGERVVERIEAALSRLLQSGLPAAKIHMLPEDVPGEAGRRFAEGQREGFVTPGFFFDGEAQMVASEVWRAAQASGLTVEQQAIQTYLHEVAGHEGLRAFFASQDQFEAAMDRLAGVIGTERMQAASLEGGSLLDFYAPEGVDSVEGASRETRIELAEEYLAHLAEGGLNVERSLVQRILDFFRQQAAKLREALGRAPTDADLKLVLEAAARNLRAEEAVEIENRARFQRVGDVRFDPEAAAQRYDIRQNESESGSRSRAEEALQDVREQLELFGDPESAERASPSRGRRSSVPDRQTDEAEPIELLGRRIGQQLVSEGAASLTGKRISGAQDLAAVAQVLRDSRFETLRYIYVRELPDTGGFEILGSDNVSSRLPGASAAFPQAAGQTTEERLAWLEGRLEERGADGVFALHNHPSGNVSSSSAADQRFTQALVGSLMDRFKGHVIIDSGEFRVLEEDKSARGRARRPRLNERVEDITDPDALERAGIDPETAQDQLFTPSTPHKLLGRSVNTPAEIAGVAKEAQTSEGIIVIGRAADGRVRGLGRAKAALLDDTETLTEAVRTFAVENGASQVALSVPRELLNDQVRHEVAVEGIADGVLMDVVTADGSSYQRMFPAPREAKGRPLGLSDEEIQKRTDLKTREEQAPYEPGPTRFQRRGDWAESGAGNQADPDANASDANASEANADATPKPSDYDDPQAFLDDFYAERLRSESEAAARGEPGTPGRPELANPADSDEVRSAVDVMDQLREEAGMPTQESMAEWRSEARRRLDADYEGERQALLEGEGGLEKVEVMMAKEIIEREGREALDSGDAQRIAELGQITKRYRERMSEAARALSAAQDENLSPAERAREDFMKVLFSPSKQNAGKMNSEDEEVVARAEAAHAEETQEIAAMLKNNGLAFAEEGQGELFAENPSRAAQAVRVITAARAGAGSKWKEYWTAAILSGMSTQVLNLGSTGANVFKQSVMRTVEMTAGSVHEAILGPKEGMPTLGEMPYFLGGVRGGLTKALSTARLGFDTEAPVLDQRVEGADTEGGWRDQAQSYSVAIGGTKGRVTRLGLRTLTAGDQFFKTIVFEMERGAQAYRLAKDNGLEGEEMETFIEAQTASMGSLASVRALEKAREASFQEALDPLSEKIRSGKNSLAQDDSMGVRLLGYFLHGFVPFVKTLSNTVRQGAKLIPPLQTLDMVQRVARHGLFRAEVQRGQLVAKPYRSAEVTKDVAQLAVTSMVGLGLKTMAETLDDEGCPYLSGSIDRSDAGARSKGYRDCQPTTIRIGDTRYDYGRFAPFSFPLAYAGDYAEARRRGKPFARANAEAASRLYDVMLESTLAAGVLDLANVIENPRRNAAKWARRFLGGHFPNFFASAMRAADPFYRDSDSFLPDDATVGEHAADYVERTARSAVPLAQIQPPPIVDPWGQEAKRNEGFGPTTDFVYRLLSPANRYDATGRLAADRLLSNWRQKLGEDSWMPTRPKDHFVRDGKKIQMTAQEYHDYQVEAGTLAKKVVKGMIERGQLDPQEPTEEQVEAIKDVFKQARDQVKEKMLRNGAFSDAPDETASDEEAASEQGASDERTSSVRRAGDLFKSREAQEARRVAADVALGSS